jgi:5'-deoxynucleotidase
MKKFFDHILNRDLAHVVRFNNRPQHFPESVAEHSFYVVYFSILLTRVMKKKGIEVDQLETLGMAAVHDMEEGFSGDILNPFKHYNDKVFEAIREVNRQTVTEVFADLPAWLSKDMVDLWKKENAQDSTEAQVVKIADKLSLLAKCREEIDTGNTKFQEIYEREMEELNSLEWDWWVQIRVEILESGETSSVAF